MKKKLVFFSVALLLQRFGPVRFDGLLLLLLKIHSDLH
jgi:hypothetical protein